ncbi:MULTISPECIES: LysR family transcriptional regulator [unclassified Streptomyces]|uniref:LysR family transcriptional regulator n=1 Tax=unclassified Streptomyces TaxID=2593676 RepID=UPI002E18D98C|nr:MULTISPECIES: LysR family transcriptional regulator [unclassified Streptomyces]
MIDVRRLQILQIVHRHGSMTAAAQALHLTPAAVSQQIHSLARDLEVELVERRGRGATLTPAAYTLLRHTDVLYAQWEAARAELAAFQSDAAGLLRITAFPTALAGLVVPAAQQLRRDAPGLRLELAEAEASQSFDLLATGATDLAVIVPLPDNPPATDPRFDQQPLADEVQDLLVPCEHPLARSSGVQLADAVSEIFVAAPDSIDQHQLILAACQAAGFVPRIEHRAQEWNAIIALVGGGFGVSLIPRSAPLPPGAPVVRVPLRGAPAPRRRLLTCVRRGSDAQPAIAQGLSALHAAAARSEVFT